MRVIQFMRDADVAEVGNYGYMTDESELQVAEQEVVEGNEDEPVVENVEPIVEKAAEPIVETPVATDWKAAIKSADKYEALKELGYGDFEIELLKYKEQTGDVTPYLEVKTVNYAAMTPEQVLKISLKKENPGLSDKAIDFKFRQIANTKYFLDRDDYPEESDEAEIGMELLKNDTDAIRNKLIEEQAKFKAPEPKPDTTKVEMEQKQAVLQQQQQQFVTNNPVTKALQAAKSITIGEGEESFNYPIGNVDALVESALQTIYNSDKADVPEAELKKFYQALAIGSDLEGFLKAYGKHHQSLAQRTVQKGLQNVTEINTGVIAPTTEKKDYAYKTQ